MNLKLALVVLLVIASLLPASWLYKWITKKIDPRRSGGRFFLWLLTMFSFIFVYTFLVVRLSLLLLPKTN